MIHVLFGGSETQPKQHKVFSVEVCDLKLFYAGSFEVFSEKTICEFILKVRHCRILDELKEKKIDFTDSFFHESEIELLIGGDMVGKLLTGNVVELDSGLTAIETKLGLTLIGRQNLSERHNILTALSLHVKLITVSKLRKLEVLGIFDPAPPMKDNLIDFKQKMEILPDDRYEVELTWR